MDHSRTRMALLLLKSSSMMKKNIMCYGIIVSFYLIILAVGSGALAIFIHLASRLIYVGFVGYSLHKQEKEKVFTRIYGFYKGFEKFKNPASVIINNDAISFCVMAYLTKDSFTSEIPGLVVCGLGLMLIIVGGGIKLWAAETLGTNGYYWGDFFMPVGQLNFSNDGPYRYFENPMYTLGYAQAYGLALFLFSWPALVLAAFDQACILIFNHFVEKPHFQRLVSRQNGPVNQSMMSANLKA